MNKAKIIQGYLFVIISAVIFGCTPLGAKFIYQEGVSPLGLVLLRNLLAVPFLALLAKQQGQSLHVEHAAWPSLILIAVMGCCFTPILLYQSYNFLDSGTATVFHFIYPAAVLLGSVLLFHQRLQLKELLCVAICSIGIYLFYTPGAPLSAKGVFFALFSGLTYATYVLLLSVFRYHDITGFKFSFYIALICSIVMFPICLITKQLTVPVSALGWAISILFSLSLCIGGVFLFQQGTFLIGAKRASILSSFEPITSICVGILVFHETVSIRTAFGSFLVILASILIAVFDKKES